MRATAKIYGQRDVAMIFFVAAIFIFAVVYSVFSATTIGDNVTTGGTLTVSSVSTFSDDAKFTDVHASSTVQATGNGIFYANIAVGGTTTFGAVLTVNGPGIFVGTSTIFGGLHVASLNATDTLGIYTAGTAAPRMVIGAGGGTNVGIATSGPGALLSVGGAGLFTATSTILGGGLIGEGISAPGLLGFYTRGTDAPRMVIHSGGNVGIATTVPGALLSVAGSGLFTATSTILSGGLITEGVTAPGILGFYTRGTAASRMVIDSSGNVGIATSGPATTLSTVGSGYFTAGLGAGYATTGAGNIVANDFILSRGRLGVNATGSPPEQIGVLGDVYAGPISTTASTTITLESGGVRSGCIELRNPDGTWVSIYAGAGSATSTTLTTIATRNQFQGGAGTGILVIAQGRCDDTD